MLLTGRLPPTGLRTRAPTGSTARGRLRRRRSLWVSLPRGLRTRVSSPVGPATGLRRSLWVEPLLVSGLLARRLRLRRRRLLLGVLRMVRRKRMPLPLGIVRGRLVRGLTHFFPDSAVGGADRTHGAGGTGGRAS